MKALKVVLKVVVTLVLLVIAGVVVRYFFDLQWREEQKLNQAARKDPVAKNFIAARNLRERADWQKKTAELNFETNRDAFYAVDLDNRLVDYEPRLIDFTCPKKDSAGKIIGEFKAGQLVRYFPGVEPKQFPGDTKFYLRIADFPYEEKDLYWVPLEAVGEHLSESRPEWVVITPSETDIVKQWGVELAPGQTSPELIVSVPGGLRWQLKLSGDGAQVFRRINRGDWELLVGGQPKDGPCLQGTTFIQVRLHPWHDQKERIRFVLRRLS